MARLRASIILAKIAVGMASIMAVQSVLTRIAPQRSKKVTQNYYKWLNKTMGVRVNVVGTPVENEPCLMVANHASWQDILLLGSTTQLAFVAKSDVAGWPVISTLAKMARTVFVDRTRRQAAAATKNEMQARLEEGETLVLFPEGTTNDGTRILPFKSSLFGASQLEVNGRHIKVQPVTIAYQRVWGMPIGRHTRSFFSWPGDVELPEHLWGNLKSGPLDVTICFHPPTDIDAAGGRKNLAKICQNQIETQLAELLANSALKQGS